MTKHRVSQLGAAGVLAPRGRFRGPPALLLLCPLALALLAPLALAIGITPLAAAEAALPRFYSLKSNPVNLRKGPGTQYPKSWVFRRAGLPVEVLRKHGRWRQLRDSDGATGWVLETLISRRRTALVAPWMMKEASAGIAAAPANGAPSKPSSRAPSRPQAASDIGLIALRTRASRRATTVAMLEPGTLVSLKSCDGAWCYVSIQDFRGYIKQDVLWGIYPREKLK